MSVSKCFRISRTIGQKNPARPVIQGFRGCCRCRHNLNAEAALPQSTQDIVFHSKIKCDDRNVCCRQRLCASSSPVTTEFVFWIPEERLTMRDLPDVIHTNDP